MKFTRTSAAVFAMLAISSIVTSLTHAAPTSRVTLQGSAPPWANNRNLVGATGPGTDIGFRVYLAWKDPAGAEALARAVSDPSSSSYGQYLTPTQFRARFAPEANTVAQLQQWLRSQGFSVQYTPQNNHYVSAEGTVAQAQAAFGTSFGNYLVQGQTLRSPTADISVPSSFASIVTSVVALDESFQFVQTYHKVDGNAPPSAGFRNSPPLSIFWAQLLSPYAFPAGFTDLALTSVPWSVKGHTPDQIKGAYGISGFDGSGQTVAIIDAYASPTILQDVNQWSTNRGLPTMKSSQLVQVIAPGTYNRPQNPRQDPQGWYGEETLDVEAVHGRRGSKQLSGPRRCDESRGGSTPGADRNQFIWVQHGVPARRLHQALRRHADPGGDRGHRRVFLLRRQRRRNLHAGIRNARLAGFQSVGHRSWRHESRRQRIEHSCGRD